MYFYRHDPSSIAIKECLDEIIDELNNLPIKTHPLQQNGLNGTSNGIQDKLLKQNHDLIDAIKKLNEEKINLRNTIIKLEEEIWQNKRNNKVCIIKSNSLFTIKKISFFI